MFCWEFSRARWHVKHGTVQSTGIIRASRILFHPTQHFLFFYFYLFFFFFRWYFINIKCHLSFERHPLFYVCVSTDIFYFFFFSPLKQSSPSFFFPSPMKLLCLGLLLLYLFVDIGRYLKKKKKWNIRHSSCIYVHYIVSQSSKGTAHLEEEEETDQYSRWGELPGLHSLSCSPIRLWSLPRRERCCHRDQR